MRNLTTDDLRKIIGEYSCYYGKPMLESTDDEVIECFAYLIKIMYEHSASSHYTSIMDEPRY